MTKLYEIDRGSKIYVDEISQTDSDGNHQLILNAVVIFDHIDGLYSYCYVEDHEDVIVHLHSSTPLEEYKDGFTIK